jgi:hypothetical protein
VKIRVFIANEKSRYIWLVVKALCRKVGGREQEIRRIIRSALKSPKLDGYFCPIALNLKLLDLY